MKVKFTTIDTFFDQKMEVVYKKILSQPNAAQIKLKPSDLVLDYLYGCYLACNTPWVLVDYVLIPMNVGKHWILAWFDIKRRSQFVYNSLRTAVGKVMSEMKRMIAVISFMLTLSNFYVKRPKVDLYPFFIKAKIWMRCLIPSLLMDFLSKKNGNWFY